MSDFPVLQRHMGAWEGTYTLMDTVGKILDQHKSRIEITRDGNAYFQRNIYTWEDGRTQTLEFPGELRDGRLWFDTERLSGSFIEAGADDGVLTWTYKNNPNQQLTELIHLVNDTERCRCWHYMENGKIVKLMVISETKVE
jgi:hypothetical protein